MYFLKEKSYSYGRCAQTERVLKHMVQRSVICPHRSQASCCGFTPPNIRTWTTESLHRHSCGRFIENSVCVCVAAGATCRCVSWLCFSKHRKPTNHQGSDFGSPSSRLRLPHTGRESNAKHCCTSGSWRQEHQRAIRAYGGLSIHVVGFKEEPAELRGWETSLNVNSLFSCWLKASRK